MNSSSFNGAGQGYNSTYLVATLLCRSAIDAAALLQIGKTAISMRPAVAATVFYSAKIKVRPRVTGLTYKGATAFIKMVISVISEFKMSTIS